MADDTVDKLAVPPVKTAKDLSPQPLGMLSGMLKNMISPGSAAGMIRDQKQRMDSAIKDSGG